jgi:hypothetical protein
VGEKPDGRVSWLRPQHGDLFPLPRTAENIQKAMVVSPVPEVQERVEEQPTENTPATDDPARTRLFKNALKAFDLDLLQNSPT